MQSPSLAQNYATAFFWCACWKRGIIPLNKQESCDLTLHYIVGVKKTSGTRGGAVHCRVVGWLVGGNKRSRRNTAVGTIFTPGGQAKQGAGRRQGRPSRQGHKWWDTSHLQGTLGKGHQQSGTDTVRWAPPESTSSPSLLFSP